MHIEQFNAGIHRRQLYPNAERSGMLTTLGLDEFPSWAEIPTAILQTELRRRQNGSQKPECGSGHSKGAYNTSTHVFALLLILGLSIAGGCACIFFSEPFLTIQQHALSPSQCGASQGFQFHTISSSFHAISAQGSSSQPLSSISSLPHSSP